MPPLSNEYVRGFDIPMNDAFSMGGFERLGNLDSQVQHFLNRQRLVGNDMLQSLAVEKLHRNKLLALMFADVVNSAYIWVI